jgi:hypothetical protein
MRGSLAMLVQLFDHTAIAAKCHHVPLGIVPSGEAEIAPKFEQGDRLRILFTNSLHGNPDSFYLRGGTICSAPSRVCGVTSRPPS